MLARDEADADGSVSSGGGSDDSDNGDNQYY